MKPLESNLRCAGCGAEVADDEALPFTCSQKLDGDGIEHVLRLFIEIDGEIDSDSYEVIKRTFKKLEDITAICVNDLYPDGFFPIFVYMNSRGGKIKSGYDIGRIFQDYRVTTIIGRGQRCSSACAIAFLGGQLRHMYNNSIVMFHSPYKERQGKAYCSNRNDQVSIELKNWYSQFLSKHDAEILHQRTMDFCSAKDGWALNADAAVVFGIAHENMDR